jgi:hypothetical protein
MKLFKTEYDSTTKEFDTLWSCIQGKIVGRIHLQPVKRHHDQCDTKQAKLSMIGLQKPYQLQQAIQHRRQL